MPTPFAFRSVFNDFEQLKEQTPQWRLDWRQLDRGPLEASVSQVATGSVLVSHSVFNRAFEQHGAAPPGGRTFGLLEKGIPETRWCGRPLLDDQANVFDRTYANHLNRASAFDPNAVRVNEPGRTLWLRVGWRSKS